MSGTTRRAPACRSWPRSRSAARTCAASAPNVVVRGGDERDLVGSRLRVGSVEVDVVEEIDRCVIVTRPQPGLARDRSVLTRVHAERAGNLGVGGLVRRGGRIAVGDLVAVV